MGSKSAIGIGNGICFKQVRDKGGGSYIDPLVRDSIVGLWKFDQNTNESPTRNIIKNTIKSKGGDLELLNFGYKLNSGYNGYPEDFTSWISIPANTNVEISNDGSKAKSLNSLFNLQYNCSYIERDIPSFKVKISNFTKGILNYYYRQEDGIEKAFEISPKLVSDFNGVIELPKSYNTIEGTTGFKGGFFNIGKVDTNLTIEQLPLYEGALVTDGKDDMIVSQKTVQEMGITNEITVVSMIHQINVYNSAANVSYTNYIMNDSGYIRNDVSNADKTGIYGYSYKNTVTVINKILGDKNDYIAEGSLAGIDSTFSIIGRNDGLYLSEAAIYWTFISNKVLTTDEINQIIAYFKLDKYVTPQVIYDVKRQGLTNDTPAADWYLKDFSGNGHDMQLYNYAKSKDSGIGKYELDFNEFNFAVSTPENTLFIKTSSYLSLTKRGDVETASRVYTMKAAGSTQYPSYKVRIEGLQNGDLVRYWYVDENSKIVSKQISENGEHTIPKSYQSSSDSNLYYSFDIISINIGTITVTQIPDYEGALVSDGKDDYGKAEGLPIFKDYTVAADRAIGTIYGSVISKSQLVDNGAFIFEQKHLEQDTTSSFGYVNSPISDLNINRKISYQSKYLYNGNNISAGTGIDGNDMWLATIRDNDTRFSSVALYSMLLFPYSLSEFLLERQLKKYKLGTLYPNMVEFRPIIKSNSEHQAVDFYIDYLPAVVGKYYPINSALRIAITTQGQVDEISSIKVNGVDFGVPSVNGNRFTFNGTLSDKFPQKIDITIDEYIRFEDIVQPYPEIWTITQNGNRVSWGDKLKVGSEFIIQSKTPLLPELYTSTNFYYNGNVVNHSTPYIVEKQMTFACDKTWKLNTTEPHAIYSPQKLNIPNSSLKILGYVPDLTGKGNHGKLNNFAYAGMSGANGYVEDFTKWFKSSSLDDVEITYDRIKVNKLTGSTVLYVTSNKFINKIKIVASGIPNGGKLTFTQYPDNAIENNKEFEIGGVTTTGSWGFSIKEGLNLDWSNLVIQQIGEHEGSICFDGTDDHITIPTLAHGGKCVMMKVNWSSLNTILYDQRVLSPALNNFSIYTSDDNDVVAYNARNSGSTYIDSVLNANIITSQLINITHNITITNSDVTDTTTVSPIIGCSTSKGLFANMSLYEFMLFPEIPSEDEMKKLNDIMGIEGGYVESPNYYWDSFGKSNNRADDIDKGIMNINDSRIIC